MVVAKKILSSIGSLRQAVIHFLEVKRIWGQHLNFIRKFKKEMLTYHVHIKNISIQVSCTIILRER